MHDDDEFAFARIMGNLGVRPTTPLPKRDTVKRRGSAADDQAADAEFESAMSSTAFVLNKDSAKGEVRESTTARRVTYTDRSAPRVGATIDLRGAGRASLGSVSGASVFRAESVERDLRAFLITCYTDGVRVALVTTGPLAPRDEPCVRRAVERALALEQRGYAERWGEAPPSLGGANAVLIEVQRKR